MHSSLFTVLVTVVLALVMDGDRCFVYKLFCFSNRKNGEIGDLLFET